MLFDGEVRYSVRKFESCPSFLIIAPPWITGTTSQYFRTGIPEPTTPTAFEWLLWAFPVHVPFHQVNIGFLAHQVRKSTANTANGCQGIHDLIASIDICVENTKNVLKPLVGKESLFQTCKWSYKTIMCPEWWHVKAIETERFVQREEQNIINEWYARGWCCSPWLQHTRNESLLVPTQ